MYSVFVQKFRFHGLPASVKAGNFTIDFSNRESLPITHEMVLISLPSGKTSQNVIDDAKTGGTKSEDEWLHDHSAEIAEKVERAFGQFERGEFFSAEESQADMEKRKAAWLREQH